MPISDKYFQHDFFARQDKKITFMLRRLGHKGYACFFLLLEILSTSDNYRQDTNDEIGMEHLQEELLLSSQDELKNVLSVLIESGLIISDENFIYSNGLLKQMNKIYEKAETNRNNRLGKKKEPEQIEQINELIKVDREKKDQKPDSYVKLPESFNHSQEVSSMNDLDEFLYNLVENNQATIRDITKWKNTHGAAKVKNVFDNWELIKKYSLNEGYTEQESFNYLKIILNGDGNIPSKILHPERNGDKEKEMDKNLIVEKRNEKFKKWQPVYVSIGVNVGNTEDGSIELTKKLLTHIYSECKVLTPEKLDKILESVTVDEVLDAVNEILILKNFALVRQNDSVLKLYKDKTPQEVTLAVAGLFASIKEMVKQ